MREQYPIGFVGRSVCEVTATDGTGLKRVRVPAGRLWRVVSVSHLDVMEPENTRYNIVLLKRSGGEARGGVGYSGAWDGLLIAEPGVAPWRREDDLAAEGQGWGVSERDCADRAGETFELQTANGDGRFATTPEAQAFVWRRAVECDDPVARRALAFLYAHAPAEYERVRAAFLAAGESP